MIFSKINSHHYQKLPFVIYQKPFSNQLICFLAKNDNLTPWKKESKGFILHPFNDGEIVFMDELNCDIILENKIDFNKKNISLDNNSTILKENFEKLVEKSIAEIQQKEMIKVVISSFEMVDIDNKKLENIFSNLINLYESAFCYWFYHPKIGMWMGATPELLVHKKEKSIKTVALAGTQLFSENIFWKNKEIEEQKWVTIYIEKILKKYCKSLNINNLKTIKAGNLAHLITEIEGDLKDENLIFELIKNLHPTPAVCGLPKEKALDFILKNEKYQREYYTGFLGEWNKNFENSEPNNTHLFVNLRCMQIIKKSVKIYVGCGITKDSIPANEYQEIINKTKTMKNVL